jgi:AcrR family transcriptional regulator
MFNESGIQTEETTFRTRRQVNKSAIRRRITVAAHDLFFERGYRSTTMAEIISAAGVTRRTLYSYFPSKIALYIEMFDHYLARYHQAIVEAARSDLPTRQRLLNLMDSIYRFTRENEKFMRLFWMIDSQEYGDDLPPELTGRIRNWSLANIEEARSLVRAAIEEGCVVEKDPELMIDLISAMNKGIVTHTHKERKFDIARVDPDALYNRFRDMVIRTFLAAG